MLQLRDYQSQAVTDTASTIKKGVIRPLIIAPTASGKSVIIAEIVKRAIDKNPKSRVLILCHQGHLLAQNEQKIRMLSPSTSTGIYCAGQGRKDRTNSVILASRDSLANNPTVCGEFNLIICDEAHMIPVKAHTSDATNYGKIFTSLKCSIVVGLTGTPWRLSRGVIFGKGLFFEKVSYNIRMRYLIEKGYLCDYSFPKEINKLIDASELQVSRNGDYKTDDLNKISMADGVVEKCVDQWLNLSSDRKCSIFFACSRDHGRMIQEKLNKTIGGENVIYIDGNTKNREVILKAIVAGKYRAVVNIGVLTTGFDAPIIDCVVWLRATASASLFVQMGGRGLRTFKDKKDCLMLDMAGNFESFYSIEEPLAEEKGGDESKQEKPECNKCGEQKKKDEKNCLKCGQEFPSGIDKECKKCLALNSAAAKKCGTCGELFISHTAKAYTDGNVGIQQYTVYDYTIFENVMSKNGNEYCKVELMAGHNPYTAQKYYINLMIYGNQHYNEIAKRKYDRFQSQKPITLQVYRDGKSKYPEVDIVLWESLKVAKLAECRHEWVEEYSPMGQKHVFCNRCEELKEFKNE